MSLTYNIYFELAAAAFMIILYIYLLLQYPKQSRINREFRKLTLLVLLADVMDVLTAVGISCSQVVPVWMNLIFNTLYLAVDAVLGYQFMKYAVSYLYENKKRPLLFKWNQIFMGIYLLFLFINLFTGHIFSFQEGEYIHGICYKIIYIIPIYYILYSGGILLCNKDCFKMKQKIFIGIFVLLGTLGPVVQMLFFPNVLLGLFTVTLGMLMMQFSLETPDYQQLIQTMEELSKTKGEAEQAKEKAQTANRAKTEFLASMSHEVRTPINAILGYNEIILRETRERNTAGYAVNVQAAGRALLSIVNDILDFTSIEGGSFVLEKAPYAVLSFLQDMITYAEYIAGQKSLELRLVIDENLPKGLSGDAVRLMQIFNNLISNAVKYTKEGYIEIDIKWHVVDQNSGVMSVQVKDSGIGIKPEDIKKLLGSFSRIDNRKTRNIKGIGLGLAIVSRLLEQMKGELQIESEYEKGSTFSFHIMQEITNREAIGKVERDAEINRLRHNQPKNGFTAPKARILAVDDNMMNLDLFRGILRETGIRIDTASNGEEALRLMGKNEYHMIFLDHMMPIMDGIEILEKMKIRRLCEEVPVIVLTANAVTGEKEKYLKAGFDGYLAKPIIGNQLEEVLRKYLPKELMIEQMEKDTGISAEALGDSWLKQLDFLDTVTGLAYCGEQEELYQEMLLSYLEHAKYEELQQLYKAEDWENYRIQVHALKSTSLSIGASTLSNQAKELERAVKMGDIDFVRQHHWDTVERYRMLLTCLRNVLGHKNIKKEKDSPIQKEFPHILVIDDNSINLQVAEKILQGKFEVSCCKSGKDAMTFLKNTIPSLILLDIHMPEMDGFGVLHYIKEKAEYKDIPVVFLTADDDRELELRGFQEGALDFITKPFIADIMIQRVSRILELDRLQKNLQQEVEKQTGKAEARRRKVERLSMQVMKTLAGTIDAKDKYTNGHSVRVAEYAKEIARRIGKSEKEQEDIYYMGLLHDIGKIGIPDEIINKVTSLTYDEYAVVKTHPIIGADILRNISEIQGIEIGAGWHHERYDGSGYPDGLKGEEIPEIARIIGVADAYDAMTSNRSYRNYLAQDIVRSEIKRGKGIQFDPYFAEIMLEMIDEDREYRMRENPDWMMSRGKEIENQLTD